MSGESPADSISWSGILACTGGAFFYLLSHSSGKDAASLQSVRSVPQLKDLSKLVSLSKSAVPLLVAVAGRVGCDQPITCNHSSLRGVIYEESAEQFFLKHNDSGAWVQDSAFLLRNTRNVPWFLEDSSSSSGSSSRAHVVGASRAAGLELTVASEVFEDASRTMVRSTVDYIQGIKVLGVKRVEKILPVGATLTVVGEAVRDDRGAVTIKRPHSGGPFFVTPKSLDSLVSSLSAFSSSCRWLALGCSAVGAALIVTKAVRYVLMVRRRAAFRRRVLEAQEAAAAAAATAAAATQTSPSAVKEETRDSGAAGNPAASGSSASAGGQLPDLCVICLENQYNAVFVPCGHMCCCIACASRLTQCPLCRRSVDQLVRTYRH